MSVYFTHVPLVAVGGHCRTAVHVHESRRDLRSRGRIRRFSEMLQEYEHTEIASDRSFMYVKESDVRVETFLLGIVQLVVCLVEAGDGPKDMAG